MNCYSEEETLTLNNLMNKSFHCCDCESAPEHAELATARTATPYSNRDEDVIRSNGRAVAPSAQAAPDRARSDLREVERDGKREVRSSDARNIAVVGCHHLNDVWASQQHGICSIEDLDEYREPYIPRTTSLAPSFTFPPPITSASDGTPPGHRNNTGIGARLRPALLRSFPYVGRPLRSPVLPAPDPSTSTGRDRSDRCSSILPRTGDLAEYMTARSSPGVAVASYLVLPEVLFLKFEVGRRRSIILGKTAAALRTEFTILSMIGGRNVESLSLDNQVTVLSFGPVSRLRGGDGDYDSSSEADSDAPKRKRKANKPSQPRKRSSTSGKGKARATDDDSDPENGIRVTAKSEKRRTGGIPPDLLGVGRKLLTVDGYIKKECQDSLAGPTGSTAERSLARVVILDIGKVLLCRRSTLKCGGCYTCVLAADDFLDNCERWDNTEEQNSPISTHIMAAKASESTSVAAVASAFYRSVVGAYCTGMYLDSDTPCGGQAILRKFREVIPRF
ncbi:hypothetical protein B0H14DRAFT_2631853 [Mycena olivaceomarginata]|nr:hypothetical protein B0H14DRAFT_2631853 [Mycena olivaceomarginata]